MTSPSRPIVVGTAGHIDHGKSRLVLALTGTDPDRLPEEKARGMTIDLGFAHTRVGDTQVHFVDVPGHERFIRNMVAGATGIDLALLVVAADDSVMPQTREHAEVLSLLEVPRCAIVITKVDLVDDDWTSQVESEVREMLGTIGIEPVACVRTSAQSGRGLDELRQVLASQARQMEQTNAIDWFRMPIDRVFTIRGRGTVVTGTASHGVVAVNDELELWPVGMEKGIASGFAAGRRSAAARLDSLRPKLVRVRGLQTHNESCDKSAGRSRLAINAAPLEVGESARGCELATPGCLTPTLRADVWLGSLRLRPGRRNRAIRTRFHAGTADVLAQVKLAAPPHDDGAPYRGFAQIRFEVPLTTAYGQHFIIRDESGSRTLGGGRVLRCLARPWRTPGDATRGEPGSVDSALLRLKEGTPAERVEEIIRGMIWAVGTEKQIACQAGTPIAETSALRDELCRGGRVIRLKLGTTDEFVHADLLSETAQGATSRLLEHLRRNVRVAGVPRGEWPGWMPRACPARLRAAVAEWIIETGRVALAGGFVVPRGHKGAVSAEDQALMEAMLTEYLDAAFQPPAVEELHCRTEKNARQLVELQKLAAARGLLVQIAAGLFLHVTRHREMIARVTDAIRRRGEVTVADVRTTLNSTRKYVVPFVEHLDATGITRRKGDLRVLGPQAPPVPIPSVEAVSNSNPIAGRA